MYVEKVYIATTDNDKNEILIPERDGPNLRSVNTYRFFRNKKVTYIWDPDTHDFFDLKMLDNNVQLTYLQLQNGLSKEEQLCR